MAANVEVGENSEAIDTSWVKMLYSICQEEGINLQFLSRNYLRRLEKDGKVRFIFGRKFDLDTHARGEIMDDKYALYCALKYAKIPIIEHAIIYPPSVQQSFAQGCNSLAYAHKYWRAHDRDIVVKANHGMGGTQVFRVREESELVPALTEVFQSDFSASLCPFYRVLHEYRLILLDGELRLGYMKTLPKEEGAWKFNLKQGSISEKIPEAKLPGLLELARQAAKAIGLRFGSIDLIETENAELMVMEINSGVMIGKYLSQHPEEYETVRAIYRDAIRKMFEE